MSLFPVPLQQQGEIHSTPHPLEQGDIASQGGEGGEFLLHVILHTKKKDDLLCELPSEYYMESHRKI